jgi:cell division protein FtsQ
MSRGAATAPARRAASSGTAERFAARVRSRRRRRIAMVVAAALVLAALGWLTVFSPYLLVEQIRIRDTERVAPQQVRELTDAEIGRPMVLLDPSKLARSVATIPLVRSVQVQRSWPSTVTVTLTERSPVAAVPASGGGYRLVDREGVEVEFATRRPAELPFLEVDVRSSDPQSTATLAAALDVLGALPASLAAQLVGIGATSPDGVWLSVRTAVGKKASKVVWGDASAGQEKAEVLAVLVRSAGPDGAALYDVSVPSAPAVRPR